MDGVGLREVWVLMVSIFVWRGWRVGVCFGGLEVSVLCCGSLQLDWFSIRDGSWLKVKSLLYCS